MVTLKAHILPHHDLQPPGCRGSPVLLSVSRKSFLRALTGRGPGDVGAATLAAELAAAAGGADFIRTHEPRPLRDGLAVLAALKETARIR